MKPQILYQCPSGIVTVVRKSSGLRRYPPSKYACGIFVLRPKEGTRVARISDAEIEFMPNFDELRGMLTAIDPKLADLFPKSLRNKPEARRKRYQRFNQRRRKSS